MLIRRGVSGATSPTRERAGPGLCESVPQTYLSLWGNAYIDRDGIIGCPILAVALILD